MRFLSVVFSACLLMLAPSAGAAGEMYQWVDENGKRQFSDKPPPQGVNAQKAAVPSATRVSGANEMAGDDESDGAGAKPRADREKTRQQYDAYRLEQAKKQAAEEEERRWREQRDKAKAKEEKCKRLKDLADKAYGMKPRYEAECK